MEMVFHHMVQMDPIYQKRQWDVGISMNYEASTVRNLFRKSKAQCPCVPVECSCFHKGA